MAETSRGPRGYPDFQREENWDSPNVIPLEEHKLAKGGHFSTGLFDCSRWAATAIHIEMIVGTIKCTALWNAEGEVGERIGTREWFMAPARGPNGQLRLSNLGQHFGLEIEGLAEPTEFALLAGFTNRLPLQEAVPAHPVVHREVATYKVSELRLFAPVYLATGSMQMLIRNAGAQPANLQVIGVLATGAEYVVGGVNADASTFPTIATGVMPLGGYYIAVQNGAAEQGIETVVMVTP